MWRSCSHGQCRIGNVENQSVSKVLQLLYYCLSNGGVLSGHVGTTLRRLTQSLDDVQSVQQRALTDPQYYELVVLRGKIC